MTDTSKQWMIISWKHDNYLAAEYGRLIEIIEGTYDEAERAARKHVEAYSPVGIVSQIL